MSFDKLKAFAVALVLVVMLVAIPVRAQVSGATLSGVVTDPSNSPVPGATLSIKSAGTGIARDVTTDADGFYSAPNLPPGAYEITTSAAGFSTQVQTGVTLTVGAQQTLNFTLKVGQVSEKIEVSSEVSQVELTSSTISETVNSTTVRELPLNGRDWTSLAVLQPGVIGIRTQIGTTGTVNRGNRGFGNQLSVAGHRPTENNYRVNGITVNDYTNGSPGSVQGAQLGVDAIQEFSVLTANYTAEYGRTSGGVINAVMKSGTNGFHGDAYWFLRDEGLDARNFFDRTIAPFHRNQFGASAGGPIIKGKTFIFGDYEGIRQTKGLTGNATVPSDAARGIDASGNPTVACLVPSGGGACVPLPLVGPGAAPNPDPVTHIDAAVLPYLAFFPRSQTGIRNNGNTATFFTSLPQIYTENYATARVDHHFSEKNDLDAVWFYDKSPQSTPDPYLLATHQTISERWLGGMEWTHSFSSALVNIARIGYNRTVGQVGQPGAALRPIAADPSFGTGIVPNRPGPIISGAGLSATVQTLGNQSTFHHVQNSFQGYDDAFLTRGNHALKFGFAVERLQNNTLAVSRPNGTFNFKGLQSFLTNHPSSFTIGDPRFETEVSTRLTILGGYLQDNWRFRPNLTLNLGMRYEMSTIPTQAHVPFHILQSLTTPPVDVSRPWQSNPTLHNFEPRVGFAWDPFKDGKMSVRGGFGIFDVLPGPWVINQEISQAPPFTLSLAASNLSAGAFPNLSGVTINNTSALGYFPEQHPHRNYAMNWNLTIQRQIGSTMTATIGYVGSHTLHSPFTTDTSNSVGPPQVIQTPVGTLWPCGPHSTTDPVTMIVTTNPCQSGFLPNGQPSTVFNPFVGQIRPTFFSTSSHYHALEAQLAKRLSYGFQGQASYTWGKCIDAGSNGDIGDPYQNSPSSLIFFAPGNRNGLCDFNVGHNFVANLIWQAPSPKFDSSIVNHVLGGWEFGAILTASTGTPFVLVMDGDPIKIKNGDSVTYPSRLAGCNPINSNFKSNNLQYVNVSCFTPPVAPVSMAAQCDQLSYSGAAAPPPAGTVYCANLYGNAGRNQLIGPKVVNLDFSVYKNNYFPRISEGFNVQFRAEMFNVLNHANFQSPLCGSCQTIFNEDGSPSGGGFLNSTSTEARQIQLSLKLIW
ncbi:MAG: TonB-dependent receptor plug domain-containing protein [Acidipila sp.]|nr:TonB-dependent receptor plug domain-containing protein [Acidipila sp.]